MDITMIKATDEGIFKIPLVRSGNTLITDETLLVKGFDETDFEVVLSDADLMNLYSEPRD